MTDNVRKGVDEKFCESCGQIIKKEAEICVKCGVRQKQATTPQGAGQSWGTTLVLCWLLGVFGVHRFYTGHTGIGIVQLLTLGGCGIWVFIDLITIFTGSYRDAQGRPLVK